jgi:hypothetical protein
VLVKIDGTATIDGDYKIAEAYASIRFESGQTSSELTVIPIDKGERLVEDLSIVASIVPAYGFTAQRNPYLDPSLVSDTSLTAQTI